MKTLENIEMQELSHEEKISINGGSEFSESFFRTVGWLIGGIVGAYQSVQANQEAEIRMGLSPRNS